MSLGDFTQTFLPALQFGLNYKLQRDQANQLMQLRDLAINKAKLDAKNQQAQNILGGLLQIGKVGKDGRGENIAAMAQALNTPQAQEYLRALNLTPDQALHEYWKDPNSFIASAKSLAVQHGADPTKLAGALTPFEQAEVAHWIRQEDKLPTKLNEYQIAKKQGLIPPNETYDEFRKRGANSTTVNIGGEQAFEKVDATLEAKDLASKVNLGQTAGNELASIKKMMQESAKIGNTTPTWLVEMWGKIGNIFGETPKKYAKYEEYVNTSANRLLQKYAEYKNLGGKETNALREMINKAKEGVELAYPVRKELLEMSAYVAGMEKDKGDFYDQFAYDKRRSNQKYYAREANLAYRKHKKQLMKLLNNPKFGKHAFLDPDDGNIYVPQADGSFNIFSPKQ